MLICNIIGIAIHLAKGNKIRGSLFARILKKDLSELKNYFKEVDLVIQSFKNEKSGEPDLMILLNDNKSRIYQR